MKKILALSLILVLLLPTFSLAGPGDRVVELGILGQGGLNPEKNLSRAEMATVAIRLVAYEGSLPDGGSSFTDVSGWALPYINKAHDLKLMAGISKDRFNPSGSVTYGQVLTILMRVLAYEDGIDFVTYPEDYHSKALEIGLADLYTPFNKEVNRGQVAELIDRALDLSFKGRKDKLISQLSSPNISEKEPDPPKLDDRVYLKDLVFNTTIIGVFTGRLEGRSDFTGYRINLLSRSGDHLASYDLRAKGDFSLEGFDINFIRKLQGYKYEVYSPDGLLVLSDSL